MLHHASSLVSTESPCLHGSVKQQSWGLQDLLSRNNSELFMCVAVSAVKVQVCGKLVRLFTQL